MEILNVVHTEKFRAMKATWPSLLLLLLNITEQATARNVCPPWFIPDNTSRTGCSCPGFTPDVKCGKHFSLMHFGICMTYNSAIELTEFGRCPYIAHYNTTLDDKDLYIQLPDNVFLLNEFMCGPLNREGTLCGKCKDGYGIALYSYTLECSKCWGHGYGWVLYYLLELFPITVMYFLVVIFHIRATSSPLSALVFMSQIVVYTVRLNVPLHMYIENVVTGFPYVAFKVLLVLCGIWSLDFFCSVIPPFCVSNEIKASYALALEYLVAFYPICLIILTYSFIKLHDNNFKAIVWLWKPFHKHFVHFRRKWDSKASIINAFTTFLLLSFSKILFVSFTLLHNISIYHTFNHHGNSRCVLYYDPTVECYTLESTIFSAVAVCMLVIFIISPTILLILYPTRLFGKCVSCCGFRRWYALHMFVKSFQGQYKDGTNGTRDFRMVSASFLILRILYLMIFLDLHHSNPPTSVYSCITFASATGFYALTRPYKSSVKNNIDISILLLLEGLSFAFYTVMYHPTSTTSRCAIVISTVLIAVPHMVLILNICNTLAKKVGLTQCLKKNYKTLKLSMLPARWSDADVESESDTGSLPDRLVNPQEYEPVLPTRGELTATESTESNEPANEDQRKLSPVYTYGSIN